MLLWIILTEFVKNDPLSYRHLIGSFTCIHCMTVSCTSLWSNKSLHFVFLGNIFCICEAELAKITCIINLLLLLITFSSCVTINICIKQNRSSEKRRGAKENWVCYRASWWGRAGSTSTAMVSARREDRRRSLVKKITRSDVRDVRLPCKP